MKKYMALFIILITMQLCSCYDRYSIIRIKNQSSVPVNAMPSYSLPDTAVPIKIERMIFVKENDQSSLSNSEDWETVINNLPSKTISIFILNADTVDAYPWDTIRSQNKYLKRYDLTVEQLKQSNWTVTYP